MKPDLVYKQSLKKFDVENADELDETELDSALYHQSLFIQHINDSIFIERFVNKFSSSLDDFGYKVFGESELDIFLQDTNQGFIVNLAQISLEEYVYPYETEFMMFDDVYGIEGIDLNALNVNIWFEFQEVNGEEHDSKIFFTGDPLFDNIKGNVKQNPFQSDIMFEYSIDSLDISTIYLYTEKLAERYAGYTLDYLLNEFVYKNNPDLYNPEYYIHYDPESNNFFYTVDRRFIEMKP